MAISHPSDISGLVLDLDPHVESYEDAGGTTPATVGNPVGSVPDQVGTIDAITQATTGAKPSLEADANGWHYLDFDGSDDWLSESTFLPTVGGAHPFTVVAVATAGTATVNQLWSGGALSGSYRQRDSRDYQLNFGSNLRRGTPDSGRHIHHTEVATASAIYIDNVLQGTKGSAGSDAWQAGIVVGRTSENFAVLNCYRILIFDRILTSQERTDLYDHLSALYANPPPGGEEPVEVTPGGTVQTQAAGSPALTQEHALAPSGTAQAQQAGTAALTQHHVISVQSTVQGQHAAAPSISQKHAVAPAGTAQSQAASASALTQLHEIAPGSTEQSQQAEASSISQAGQFVPRGTAQAQSAAKATITQEHQLAPSSTKQAQEAAAADLTQHHELEAADTYQSQATEAPSVSEGFTLVPASTSQSQAASAPTIAQTHALTPGGTTQTQTTAAPAFVQTHTLTPGTTLQTQLASTTQVFEGGAPVLRTLVVTLSDAFTLSPVLSDAITLTTSLEDPFTLTISIGD